MPLALGPFELLRPIAEGGMGQVWSGRHEATPVAIKVLTGGAAWDPSYRALFRNEVRAAAKLTHPGIIAVLDHGEIPAAVADATKGQLVAGSPYLVMEFASGGRLRRSGLHWGRLRKLLHHLLDALGHAHARGVVHRDLKPSNILLAGRDDLRGGAKISDFGIAWVGDQPVDAAFAGTVQYMAPEQHEGDWPAYGPWTDLYALGVVAWWLACGRTPFHAFAGRAVSRAHVFMPPPPLAARFPLPPGFEAWLRVLLHKDPTARFQCAADAIAGLDDLDDGDLPAEEDDVEETADQPTLIGGRTGSVAPSSSSGLGDRIHTDEAPSGPAPEEVPPEIRGRLPTDWRVETPHVPMALRGAGLGLYELREPNLVGRVGERDHLWRALRASDRTGRPRVVWLHGQAGVGKTRLATWFRERAHECAGVEGLHLDDDDVDAAIAHHLGVERLAHDDRADAIQDRMRRCPSADLARALIESLNPNQAVERSQRLGAYRALLEWRAEHRPAIIVVDEAHEADDALALAEQVVLEPQRGRRAIVVVLITRDDRLPQSSKQRTRIQALMEASKSPKDVTVGPLAESERRELLKGLGLSGPLAARVDTRSGGNPMFMVQLLGDWVERELLSLGADGFTLEGAEPEVPASLSEVWTERIDKLLEPLPPRVGAWVERAAVWGMEIDDDEWHLACDLGPDDEDVADLLVARMLDAKLAEETPQGWRFAHALLREGLLARAETAGRRADHHRACVTALQAAQRVDHARLGRHLMAAGRAEEAVNALLQAFDDELSRHGVHAAERVYLPCQNAMEQAIEPSDMRWSTLWKNRATLLLQRGEKASAVEWATKARDHAADVDLDAWCRACLSLGRALEVSGDLKGALHELKVAVSRRLRARARDLLLAQLLERMGSLARALGQLADADQWSTQALAVLYRVEAPPGRLATVLMEQALNSARAGNVERALELFDDSQAQLEGHGTRLQLAHLQNNRADTLVKLGRVGDAEEGFRKASAAMAALGADTVIPDLNTALCLLRRGLVPEAHTMLLALEKENPSRARHIAALVQVGTAAASARAGDLEAVRARLEPAGETLSQAGFIDPDLMALYVLTAEALEGHAEARVAWRFAKAQALAMNEPLIVALADEEA